VPQGGALLERLVAVLCELAVTRVAAAGRRALGGGRRELQPGALAPASRCHQRVSWLLRKSLSRGDSRLVVIAIND